MIYFLCLNCNETNNITDATILNDETIYKQCVTYLEIFNDFLKKLKKKNGKEIYDYHKLQSDLGEYNKLFNKLKKDGDNQYTYILVNNFYEFISSLDTIHDNKIHLFNNLINYKRNVSQHNKCQICNTYKEISNIVDIKQQLDCNSDMLETQIKYIEHLIDTNYNLTEEQINYCKKHLKMSNISIFEKQEQYIKYYQTNINNLLDYLNKTINFNINQIENHRTKHCLESLIDINYECTHHNTRSGLASENVTCTFCKTFRKVYNIHKLLEMISNIRENNNYCNLNNQIKFYNQQIIIILLKKKTLLSQKQLKFIEHNIHNINNKNDIEKQLFHKLLENNRKFQKNIKNEVTIDRTENIYFLQLKMLYDIYMKIYHQKNNKSKKNVQKLHTNLINSIEKILKTHDIIKSEYYNFIEQIINNYHYDNNVFNEKCHKQLIKILEKYKFTNVKQLCNKKYNDSIFASRNHNINSKQMPEDKTKKVSKLLKKAIQINTFLVKIQPNNHSKKNNQQYFSIIKRYYNKIILHNGDRYIFGKTPNKQIKELVDKEYITNVKPYEISTMNTTDQNRNNNSIFSFFTSLFNRKWFSRKKTEHNDTQELLREPNQNQYI